MHRAFSPLVIVLAVAVPAAADPQAPLQLSIGDAMQRAERVSNPLAADRANADRARANVLGARSSYWPQINLAGSYVRTLDSEFDALFDMPDVIGGDMGGDLGGGMDGDMTGGFADLPFGRRHTWRAGVDVTQQIWDGGRTAATVAIAKAAEDFAELDIRSTQAQVVLTVTEAYFGAVLATKTVAIGEASLALAERTLAQAKVGFEQGTTAEFDLVRAEVTRDNQRTSLVRARADREFALDRLRQLIGVRQDRAIELTSEPAQPAREDVGQLARRIARLPPEQPRVPVAQARSDVDANRAQVRFARAAWWPQLGAFSSLGVVQYPSGFVPDADWRRNWTVGVTVAFPLFDGFRRTADIRAARAGQRAAEAQLAEIAELATVDERRSYRDASVAAETVAASRRSASLARRAYAIAEVRYAQGVSTYLELADARLSLDQAQINLASAERDLQVATVRIALLPALPLFPITAVLPTPPATTLVGTSRTVTPLTPTTPTTTTPPTSTPTTPTATPGQQPGRGAASGLPGLP